MTNMLFVNGLIGLIIIITAWLFLLQIRDRSKKIHAEVVTANHWYKKLSEQLTHMDDLIAKQNEILDMQQTDLALARARARAKEIYCLKKVPSLDSQFTEPHSIPARRPRQEI